MESVDMRPNRLASLATLLSAAALVFASVASATLAPDDEPDDALRSKALYGADFSQDASFTQYSNVNTTATTDDHSTNTPTGWWFYTGVTAAQVSSYLSANSARLVGIDLYAISNGTPYFTVRMVANTGAYAVPGWWWYYGLTGAQVSSYISSNNARLIDVKPYDTGDGTIRFAVIMVSNTGTAARSWWWYYGASTTTISNALSANGARLTDLDSYLVGGTRYYTAVMVANTGADAKTWWWYYGLSSSQVSSYLSSNVARLTNIERTSAGTYNVVMVRNSGTDSTAWWWYLSFTSSTALLNYALQLGIRPIDIKTYTVSGSRRYLAAFIDNSNAPTRRVRDVFATRFLDTSGNPTRGIFESYVKRAGSSVIVNLNSSYPTEVASAIKVLHLLHAMKSYAGGESLSSGFTYYDYPNSPFNANTSNACPISSDETTTNRRTSYTLLQGLQQMMAISDNRTTRGVGLRYGFDALRSTASAAGLTRTYLRSTTTHNNLGCAYYDTNVSKWTDPGNDTTAADLAKIYEGVWTSSLLTGDARTQFLNTANPSTGVASALQTIINQEATSLGKSSATASSFGSQVKFYTKGGSYASCLPASDGSCAKKVIVQSWAGLVRLPAKSSGYIAYRTYSFGTLISDVPVTEWSGTDASNYIATYNSARYEAFRSEIRSALATW
jgi:hypothetical protein